jgi:hypothetical protein
VTRLFTGADGQTHAEQLDLKLTPSALLDGTERSDRIKMTALQIVRWPPGHVNDWHNASETPGGHQYVVTISGRGEVEVTGGQKVLLEPGRILLGEDLTGKGHITRTVGSRIGCRCMCRSLISSVLSKAVWLTSSVNAI